MPERFAELDYIDGYHYTHWRELPPGAVVRVDDLLAAIDALHDKAPEFPPGSTAIGWQAACALVKADILMLAKKEGPK